MKKVLSFCLFLLILILDHSISFAKEVPKIAVWDLTYGDIKGAYAQDLTLILGSEISKLGKYEVYSQENVRTLAGWTAEKMQLGCTDTKCLTALGQMDIAKLISGRVGKIGNRFSVSLSLFDTQNARAERMISEFCRSEDELIELVQVAVRKLLGEEMPSPPSIPAMRSQPQMPQPSATLGTWKDPVAGMEFVFVKGGCFQMGDAFGDGGNDEMPVHEACVDDFYMGKYEVTQAQWQTVMGSNPSSFRNCGRNCPVETVSWNDVQEFISRLNQRAGKRFRLPTAAEWEYAARSGGKREKFAGTNSESDLGDYAWYYSNSGRSTHPVGEKKPNGLGLFDMSGNIWEWCQEWYDRNYYHRSPKDNPAGPDRGSSRVLRGGSWGYNARYARAVCRGWDLPAIQDNNYGFRLVLAPR